MREEMDLEGSDRPDEGAEPADAESGAAANGDRAGSIGGPEPVEDTLRLELEEVELLSAPVRYPLVSCGGPRKHVLFPRRIGRRGARMSFTPAPTTSDSSFPTGSFGVPHACERVWFRTPWSGGPGDF